MKRFPFFYDLSIKTQNYLENYSNVVTLPPRTVLFSQGDVCQDILFLVDGSVRVYRQHESGQEITLYYLEPFEQCNVNLNSAFSKEPAIATAMAETEITGYLFPSDVVKNFYVHERAYQQYIFDLFTHRLEGMVVLVEDLRFKKMDERLMAWLKQYSKPIIYVTHDELASHLGTSREVVSRILKEFEKQNLVELSRGKIRLL